MANPPVTRFELSATTFTVIADKTKFTFPLATGNPAALAVPFADLTPFMQGLAGLTTGQAVLSDMVHTLSAKLDAAVAAMATANTGTAAPAPAPTVHPIVDTMAFNQQPLSPNCVIRLAEGVQQGNLHIQPEQGPVTFIGAGMRKTILDGQGGLGAGHRLAWGKGIIHTQTPTTIRGVGFINGGGADGVSDGETSVYPEQFATRGTCLLEYCAFDGNENGIFSPPMLSRSVDYVVRHCVFGRLRGDGLDDGRSHDTYVSALTFTIQNCIFAGTSRGNTIKGRTPDLLIEDSFIGRRNGRWIDLPGATNLTTNRNVFVTWPDAGSNNAFGLNDEQDGAVNPGMVGTWISTDDTFYFSRSTEVFWLFNNAIAPQLIRPKIFWIGPPGGPKPNIVVQDNAWQHPFIFDESNRVDAPPALPPDPVMPA